MRSIDADDASAAAANIFARSIYVPRPEVVVGRIAAEKYCELN